jgi:antitoxin component of MazEF toxin-antitoxin module
MRQVIEVFLDNQEHIVLSPTLTRRLGLTQGTTLVVEAGAEGEMWLQPQRENPIIEDKDGVFVVKAQPLRDLTDITRQERERRVFELLQRVDL